MATNQKRSRINEVVPNSRGSSPVEVEKKVIESKTICYCSNFDLNINEWFNEYENIEIFKINIKKNLGKNIFDLPNLGTMWLQYFREAIALKLDSTKFRKREDYFFTVIFNFYLVNYYCPANQKANGSSRGVDQKPPMTWHSE